MRRAHFATEVVVKDILPWSTNTGAIRLWKRHGFEEVGRLPGAFMHPDLGPTDALILFRTL